jgi:hypothetical protein
MLKVLLRRLAFDWVPGGTGLAPLVPTDGGCCPIVEWTGAMSGTGVPG